MPGVGNRDAPAAPPAAKACASAVLRDPRYRGADFGSCSTACDARSPKFTGMTRGFSSFRLRCDPEPHPATRVECRGRCGAIAQSPGLRFTAPDPTSLFWARHDLQTGRLDNHGPAEASCQSPSRIEHDAGKGRSEQLGRYLVQIRDRGDDTLRVALAYTRSDAAGKSYRCGVKFPVLVSIPLVGTLITSATMARRGGRGRRPGLEPGPPDRHRERRGPTTVCR